MVNWDEQERVRQLLTEALTVLCKNGLKYSSKFCVEGLLGITIDDNDILLINIRETVKDGQVQSGISGTGPSPMQHRTPTFSARSPAMGSRGRMAVTSPRRGRFVPRGMATGRGRSPISSAARKRSLFPSPGQSNAQMAMPLPDQSGLSEGPPPKQFKQETIPGPGPGDSVIEIEDDEAESQTLSPDQGGPDSNVKQEAPDVPSSSTDQPSETKFTLDGDTNKSLTDFLDNLMSQHEVGTGVTAASTSGQSSTPLSQMSQMTPKAEPMSWDQQGGPGFSSPQPGASFSPSQQSQVIIPKYVHVCLYLSPDSLKSQLILKI